MTFERIYADELAYLREVGREFSRDNPNLAPLLQAGATDPDVERLLESFAFLTAKIRARLDEELPELVHGLLGTLWPQLLRPLPAATTIEWTGQPRLLQRIERLPRGLEISSRPVEGTPCQFRTCYDVDLAPIRIEQVLVDEAPRSAVLRLKFSPLPGTPQAPLGLRRLRLHLTGGTRGSPVAQDLLCRLLTDLEGIVLKGDGWEAQLPATALEPVGFAENDALVQDVGPTHPGLRLLKEYLFFPAKFHYVDLQLGNHLATRPAAAFEISFRLSRPLDGLPALDASQFRLHCTPAINLFEKGAQPIELDGTRLEYRLRAGGLQPAHAVVHSVHSVRAWRQGSARPLEFQPFESFRHVLAPGKAEPFYRLRVARAATGRRTETYVTVVHPDPRNALTGHVLSADLLCTNGRLPELLPAGGVDRAGPQTPPFARFANIDAITPQADPPLEGDQMARLVGILSSGFGSMANAAAINTLFAAFDFRAAGDAVAQRRLANLIDAITNVHLEPLDWLVRGRPVRGHRVLVTVAENQIGGTGAAFILGAVLDAFFASFAMLNTCLRTEVRCADAQRDLSWPVRLGSRPRL